MIKYKNSLYKLEDNEYNALNNITAINGIDCWFCIKTSKNGLYDYVYDLEEGKVLSWGTALCFLQEGLLEEDFFDLPKNEQKALNKMFKKYNLMEVE